MAEITEIHNRWYYKEGPVSGFAWNSGMFSRKVRLAKQSIEISSFGKLTQIIKYQDIADVKLEQRRGVDFVIISVQSGAIYSLAPITLLAQTIGYTFANRHSQELKSKLEQIIKHT